MLALVVARPGLVRDGLSALLSATPDIHQIVQVEEAAAAWEFVKTICPSLTIVHASPLTLDLIDFVEKEKNYCQCSQLLIVTNEADRKTAVSLNPDLVIMEGTPSAKLATYITTLLKQQSKGHSGQLKENN